MGSRQQREALPDGRSLLSWSLGPGGRPWESGRAWVPRVQCHPAVLQEQKPHTGAGEAEEKKTGTPRRHDWVELFVGWEVT